MMPTCPTTPLTKTSATGAASPKTAILKGRGTEKRRERVSIANMNAPGVL
jgi:hypothetical protein